MNNNADDRAYLAREVELKKVAATKAQTSEIRLLREALERLIDKLGVESNV